jgi:hypothetical protein
MTYSLVETIHQQLFREFGVVRRLVDVEPKELVDFWNEDSLRTFSACCNVRVELWGIGGVREKGEKKLHDITRNLGV